MLSLYNPWYDLLRWSDPVLAPKRAHPERFSPAIDIAERDTGFELSVELPGVKPEDVEVKLENGVLTVSGERRDASNEEHDGYRRIERRYGSFCRSFELPDNVRHDAVTAELTDGVLTITVPKGKRALARKIEVNGSRSAPVVEKATEHAATA